jgi:hypothetical protein
MHSDPALNWRPIYSSLCPLIIASIVRIRSLLSSSWLVPLHRFCPIASVVLGVLGVSVTYSNKTAAKPEAPFHSLPVRVLMCHGPRPSVYYDYLLLDHLTYFHSRPLYITMDAQVASPSKDVYSCLPTLMSCILWDRSKQNKSISDIRSLTGMPR